MGKISIATQIQAPIERVFDLARSIDLHTKTASDSGEEAIEGRTSGLIGLGEFVRWRGTHFGLTLTHTSKITEFRKPFHFRDEMIAGNFAHFVHDHFFNENGTRLTTMTDELDLASPFWPLGLAVDVLVLDRYFKDFLGKRNKIIKNVAESNQWREFRAQETSEPKNV